MIIPLGGNQHRGQHADDHRGSNDAGPHTSRRRASWADGTGDIGRGSGDGGSANTGSITVGAGAVGRPGCPRGAVDCPCTAPLSPACSSKTTRLFGPDRASLPVGQIGQLTQHLDPITVGGERNRVPAAGGRQQPGHCRGLGPIDGIGGSSTAPARGSVPVSSATPSRRRRTDPAPPTTLRPR